MSKFLKSKKDETLLKVIAGKIFTDPKEVIKKDVTASFLECITVDGSEQLVYLVYTKTGEYSERNDFYVVEGEFDSIFPKPVERAVPTADELAALEVAAAVAIENVKTSIIETDNNRPTIEEVLSDTYRNN